MTIAHTTLAITCPYCGSSELRVEAKTKFLVCRSCGSVIDDMPIDYSSFQPIYEQTRQEHGRTPGGVERRLSTVLGLVEKIGFKNTMVDDDYAEFLEANQHSLRELLSNTCVRERLARLRSKDILRPLLALLVSYTRGLGDTIPSLYAHSLDRRRRSLLSRKAREIISECLY